MSIRPATPGDAKAVVDIYNYYISNTVITFEEVEIQAPEMYERIQAIQSQYPFLVYGSNTDLKGYAYASAWRPRSAYRYAVETTVYLQADLGGQGLGTALYQALLDELRARQFHSAIGGIALPNVPSVALHEKLGFAKVAHFHQVGRKFEQWIDVGYWQLML